MSTVPTDETSDGQGISIRRGILSAYYFLRKSLWGSVALLGAIFVVLGFLMDMTGTHLVYAGMFVIFGVQFILTAALFQAIIIGLRIYWA